MLFIILGMGLGDVTKDFPDAARHDRDPFIDQEYFQRVFDVHG
mgnify:CR=1 FL=1